MYCGCNHTLGLPGLWVTLNSVPQKSRAKWNKSPQGTGMNEEAGVREPCRLFFHGLRGRANPRGGGAPEGHWWAVPDVGEKQASKRLRQASVG